MRGDAVLSESCVRILKPCREVRSMTSRPPTMFFFDGELVENDRFGLVGSQEGSGTLISR
jgi:hypothetical protein